MRHESANHRRDHRLFLQVCNSLASLNRRLPHPARRAQRADTKCAAPSAGAERLRNLSEDIARASIPMDAETMLSAARGIAVTAAAPFVASMLLATMVRHLDLLVVSAFLAIAVPVLAKEAFLSYPRALAARKGSLIARAATNDLTLMIMSLRHEPSLPKAMALVAKRNSEFAAELRESIWSVISGVNSTFEEALHNIARRWAGFCDELKPAIRAMITASCEATDAGRRRALDRASEALVTGAKGRIEEYALSLSVPSMVLFGIGILLPLMVGSFLPMLSWDIWSGDSMQAASVEASTTGILLQTVVIMNVVFPAVALVVALDAVSKHPMAITKKRTVANLDTRSYRVAMEVSIVTLSSVALVAASVTLLEGPAEYVSCVLSASVPALALLTVYGSRAAPQTTRGRREHLEDLLFSAGARMVDGENLEAALYASRPIQYDPSQRRPTDDDSLIPSDGHHPWDEWSNEERALEVVMLAAAKDEAQAGMLSMDLAGYVRDVAELEAVLRRRLKPTLSMMRLTTYALAPIMLGVTHTIYVSLSSIGDGAGGLAPRELFVTLAAFLIEINVIVAYFAWGIGDRRRVGGLAHSAGSCTLVAMLILSAVVLATVQ